MAQILFEELSTRLFSPRLWSGFAAPTAMGPLGGTYQCPSGNPAFGFFDDFHSFQATTLEGPYQILEVASCTVEQVADTGVTATTALGQIMFDGVGDTQDDEMGIMWGRGLGAPFKFTSDICFEARLTVSAITGEWTWGLGLAEVGGGAANGFIADGGAMADANMVGFAALTTELGVLDGMYKADGQTYQDGAVQTDLNALATMTASTFTKLGFRYHHHSRKLAWFVDGVEVASINKTALDAATFPDDVFMAPVMTALDVDGDTAFDMYLDWWAGAQYL